MKSTVFMLMIMLSSPLMAGPEDRHSDLNLTESQKEQMAAVQENSRDRMRAAREEIQNKAFEEMAVFLTAEQLAQIKQQKQHRLERGKTRKNHKRKKRFREEG